MRVGYVVHTYPALSHAFIQREVLGLRRAGVEVHTLSVHRAGDDHVLSAEDSKEAAGTASILPVAALHLLSAHLRALRHPVAYARTIVFAVRNAPPGLRPRVWQIFYFIEGIYVWAWARRHSVDQLHAHLANVATDDVWLASVFDRFTARGPSWRWSFTMHGPTEFFAVERFNLARKVAAADGVICISDFCRSQLMLLCPSSDWQKLGVVHCGADLGRYRYRRPPQSEQLRILCVGRLVARKGQALLLHALSQLSDAGVRASLTLVGSGPALKDLQALAGRLGVAGQVRFAGPKGQDELPAVFSDHDVFCLPSLAEGVPVVLMEAMATGLPVVATAVAGVTELVTAGTSGLLVAPGRADALAEALTRLGQDRDLCVRLSEAGRRAVEAGFDSAECAAELAARFSAMQERGPATGWLSGGPSEESLLHDL
ncbi:MAG TPA: glycosyltransferase family 4 protein [Acidimicrobiales bacterium]|nr:glycosyltransferase family 4 protein [Acidimicrobiales bacterium]